ncbi:MAG TPA: hypothetical protein VJG49_01675 [Candidatus Nanoarchaeia archaeon]|nr:hypothetical protein [Candidatus Nanoarchaeia archaeon]
MENDLGMFVRTSFRDSKTGQTHEVPLVRLGVSDTLYVDAQGNLFLKAAPGSSSANSVLDQDGGRYYLSTLAGNSGKSPVYRLNESLIESKVRKLQEAKL